MESKGIDLSPIYKLRKDFTIVALTGQTGAGCSDVASQLAKGFDDGKDFDDPIEIFKTGKGVKHNSFRKLRIVYNYAKENFKPYSLIRYKDVITLFILKYPLNDLIKFLNSPEIEKEFQLSSIPIYEYKNEISALTNIKDLCEKYFKEIDRIDIPRIKEKGNGKELFDFYFSNEFIKFSENFHALLGKDADSNQDPELKKGSAIYYHKAIQIISNNLRKSGEPYNFSTHEPNKIFSIAELINLIIKSQREVDKEKDGRTQVVINSLKNPFEIMFFRQRYSAFYSIAVNRDENSQDSFLRGKFTMATDYETQVAKVIKEEYNGGSDSEFYKQNVKECIQQSDIHISFLTTDEVNYKNERLDKDNTTPYFNWQNQLLKYISLIDHPGLVTPSPEERCMQLAFTAKHNSGCISRHVGAAITDENYSVKAIGWNNTPEGQVPCVLRNAEDLLNNRFDLDSFTPFEKKDQKFRLALAGNFEEQIKVNQSNLKGRNVCFCFKSLKNSISEGKNQVHTRSLHAEESAFLQITKYGGTGIKGGKLFSTASPCELCAKKAYQLGIKIIYYIDPYPGISTAHILSAGNPQYQIEVRLFNGAIGNAYHWLYDPIMPYKDEMSLLLGHEIKDENSRLKDELKSEKNVNKKLLARIQELEGNKN